MRIIVLGPKGQLGSDVIRVLNLSKVDAIPVGRDIIDAASVDVNVQLEQLPEADFIINCVAYVNVDKAETERPLASLINTAFPYLLANHCQRKGIRLIHISTDFVFAGSKGTSYLEDDVMSPVNYYGITKAAGELAVRGSNPASIVLRVSALFGAAGSGSKGGNFVETMLRLGRANGVVRVVDDQITSPTHSLDVARAISSLVKAANPPPGIYHCANKGSCSWFEFAREIIKMAAIDARVEPMKLGELNMLAKRPLHTALETEKIEKFYRPAPWQEALKEYLILKGHNL